jgi:uncharacterized protein (TIGR02594 family)
MATKKQGAAPVRIKDDEIRVDTSSAPWMAVAEAEEGKKIHELPANDGFIDMMRNALTFDARMRALDRSLKQLGANSLLLATKPSGFLDAERFNLGSPDLYKTSLNDLGKRESAVLKERNPEIAKYFDGLKTDPIYNKKGKSFAVAPTYAQGAKGNITPWCAAFVNWCLSQAGAPHLGYSTAKSWLDLGTPIAHPVRGCVAVTKPMSSTGSSTGHVAFFVERQGDKVVLLGGNQSDQVKKSKYNQSVMLGYRWPTRFNYYLLAGTGVPV